MADIKTKQFVAASQSAIKDHNFDKPLKKLGPDSMEPEEKP